MDLLLTEIKQRIVEEQGVSAIVYLQSNNILNSILKDSKQYKWIDGKKKGSIKYQYTNNIINVHYTIYYIDKGENVSALFNPGSSRMLTKNNYELVCTVIYYRDKNKYIDYDGTISHEFEHIYQQIMANKPMLVHNTTNNRLYNIAIHFMKQDAVHQIIGYTIYYSFRFERDAFINELYKKFKDSPNVNHWTILQNSLIYQNINIIKKYVLKSDNLIEKITNICENELNKTYKWFYKLTDKTVNEYINKIGKLITKYENEINLPTTLDGFNKQKIDIN